MNNYRYDIAIFTDIITQNHEGKEQRTDRNPHFP